MLEDLKILLPYAEIGLLQIYIKQGISLVKTYLNNPKFTKEYIGEHFTDAIVLIVQNAYMNKDNTNITSMTQGARSVSYADNTSFCITKGIADMLPSPYIRMW